VRGAELAARARAGAQGRQGHLRGRWALNAGRVGWQPLTSAGAAFLLVHLYQLDITVKQGRDKVRELFAKNAHLTDPRVIDMLVIKVRARRSPAAEAAEDGRGGGWWRRTGTFGLGLPCGGVVSGSPAYTCQQACW